MLKSILTWFNNGIKIIYGYIRNPQTITYPVSFIASSSYGIVLSGNYGGNTAYITSIIRYKSNTSFQYYSPETALSASYVAIGY